LLATCEELTPAGTVNGTLSDDFQAASGSLDSDTWDTTLSNNPSVNTTAGDMAAMSAAGASSSKRRAALLLAGRIPDRRVRW